jgi:hypothetical protein
MAELPREKFNSYVEELGIEPKPEYVELDDDKRAILNDYIKEVEDDPIWELRKSLVEDLKKGAE